MSEDALTMPSDRLFPNLLSSSTAQDNVISPVWRQPSGGRTLLLSACPFLTRLLPFWWWFPLFPPPFVVRRVVPDPLNEIATAVLTFRTERCTADA